MLKANNFLQHQVSVVQVLYTDSIYDFSISKYLAANLFTVFFHKSMFFFLIVFVNDYSSGLPAMSTPVCADGPVPRFASPSKQIGMSSAVFDRYYF